MEPISIGNEEEVVEVEDELSFWDTEIGEISLLSGTDPMPITVENVASVAQLGIGFPLGLWRAKILIL